ncbi:MAG: NUDIX domain-containing protein [Parvibaculum sp.]
MKVPETVPEKVLIYATSARGLLVFDEPDFPEVPIQVPGGTVDAGEELLAAASREFHEETGLTGCSAFRFLGTADYHLLRDGVSRIIRRSYFHLSLEGDLPESWHHTEETPSDGGPAVLFRLFWLDLAEARSRLGLGMAEYLDRLS